MAIMSFASPGQFATFLGSTPYRIQKNQEHFLKQAARLVQQEAQGAIGTYQGAAPPFGAWSPLAPSTVAEKTRLGYAPPDRPLLRTGAMRASIEYRVSVGQHHGDAMIGSDSPVAVAQELGTRTIPPRSFLGSAASRNARMIAALLGQGVVSALVDSRGGSIDIPIP